MTKIQYDPIPIGKKKGETTVKEQGRREGVYLINAGKQKQPQKKTAKPNNSHVFVMMCVEDSDPRYPRTEPARNHVFSK